ncbi:MAG: KH domain-containing protein [Selenomonadaceae bacterium]|nr:KH domain-containing protein [Selenomonadaceae bacterium]MBP3721869.1 KH domain-containing protein [Selenomonadaceae bacterium]
MKELVETIAKALADDVEAVKTEERVNEDGTEVVSLKVAESDMGKVIGKGGRIAKAIRSVVKAASMKENKRVLVEILDEKSSAQTPE